MVEVASTPMFFIINELPFKVNDCFSFIGASPLQLRKEPHNGVIQISRPMPCFYNSRWLTLANKFIVGSSKSLLGTKKDGHLL